MATVSDPNTGDWSALIPEKEHPAWCHRFNKVQRQKMIADDLEAGLRVPLVLSGILLVGLALAVVSLAAIW